ncbi:MAG: thioredoxin family protein [Polyangiaceae bacterium]
MSSRPSRTSLAPCQPRVSSGALSAACSLAFAASAALTACSHAPDQSKQKAGATAPASADSSRKSSTPPSFVRYPGQGGAIEPWVQEQVELADAAHERVLVYVGATWCEPCQRFHEAVRRGELNGSLNGLRFLEFDQDHDASALKTAGYLYQYIPVLALPDPDGRNHGRMISGSIKGPRAIQEDLVPRLQALLSGKVAD